MAERKSGKKSTALSARADLPVAVDGLFAKVTAILDRARGSVVRSVNSEMVLAYWHIGRAIVEALQGGSERAEYGSTLIETLAQRLTGHYGKGFSSTNLRYFRSFYQVYAERTPEIRHMACGESGGNLDADEIRHTASGVLDDVTLAVENADRIRGFSPRLGWSHYRALMNVENKAERMFYDEALAHDEERDAEAEAPLSGRRPRYLRAEHAGMRAFVTCVENFETGHDA